MGWHLAAAQEVVRIRCIKQNADAARSWEQEWDVNAITLTSFWRTNQYWDEMQSGIQIRGWVDLISMRVRGWMGLTTQELDDIFFTHDARGDLTKVAAEGCLTRMELDKMSETVAAHTHRAQLL